MKEEFYLKYNWIFEENALNFLWVFVMFLIEWYLFCFSIPDPLTYFQIFLSIVFLLIFLPLQFFVLLSAKYFEAYHLAKKGIAVITITNSQIEYKLAEEFPVLELDNISSCKLSKVLHFTLLKIEFKRPIKDDRKNIPIFRSIKFFPNKLQQSCVWTLPEFEGDIELINAINLRIPHKK